MSGGGRRQRLRVWVPRVVAPSQRPSCRTRREAVRGEPSRSRSWWACRGSVQGEPVEVPFVVSLSNHALDGKP